jgi:hypothetical protein
MSIWPSEDHTPRTPTSRSAAGHVPPYARSRGRARRPSALEFHLNNPADDQSGCTAAETEPTDPRQRGKRSALLRLATREAHDLVDRRVSRFDLARRSDYCAFLAMHHAALLNLDHYRRVEDLEDFDSMRSCLQRDLGIFGVTVAAQPIQAPRTSDVRAQLGVAYVVRGSRLGSRVLRRRPAPSIHTPKYDLITAF